MPPGDYTVRMRGIDNHDQATTPPAERHVTVTHPPGNTAPVADFTVSCPAPGQAATATNVCEFDGRSSTDENAATLAYSWNYGNGTGSGALTDADVHLGEHLHGDADGDRRVGRRERCR